MTRNSGYTLLELLIVMVLMSIVASITGMMLSQGFRNYQEAKPILTVAGKVGIAASNIMRELKSARRLESFSASRIVLSNQQDQNITFQVNGNTLTKQVDGSNPYPVINNVLSAHFAYFDSALASTNRLDNVTFVTFEIKVLEQESMPYSLMTGTLIRKRL